MAEGPEEGPEEKGPKELREIKEKSVDIKKDALEIKKKSGDITEKYDVNKDDSKEIEEKSKNIIKSSEKINKISKKMEKKIKPELWPMGTWTKWAIAIYFVVLVVFISYFLLATWPVSGTEDDSGKVEYFFGRITLYMPMEARLILLVILAGALGSCIHLGTSFVFFLGKGELKQSFAGWYMLRPFIGASLAALFYFAFRGVLFTATPSDFNLYGVVAIAALAGMFAKQATEKLREVFDKIFMPVQDIEKEKKVGEAEKLDQIIKVFLAMLPKEKGKVEIAKLKGIQELISLMPIGDEMEGEVTIERWRTALKTLFEYLEAIEESEEIEIEKLRKILISLKPVIIWSKKFDEEKLREIIQEQRTRLTGATGKEEGKGSVPPERETEEGEEE